ncbi:ARM repeat superfamily protein [Wolffia australiana]
MEGVELEVEHGGIFQEDDVGALVIARLENSHEEEHRRVCAMVGAMAQELEEQGFPRSPITYFGATIGALDRLSRNPSCGADRVVSALVFFLFEVLQRVPRNALRSRAGAVMESLGRVLMSGELTEGELEGCLRCVQPVIVVGGKDNWPGASPLYKITLDYVTDSRPAVRKMSYLCIRDILQSLRGSPTLASASEDIKAMFERFLLLAAGSDTASVTSVEGRAGGNGWNIVYMLNALQYCLPFMISKHRSKILGYFKPLLELQHSIVTRNIMDILQALCLDMALEVAPEVFMELICLLATAALDKDYSSDSMASTARLLSAGTKKIYGLNRQTCIVKLPLIVNALGGILARGHGEAVFAATESLKSLISTCVDDALIKQGVDQISQTEAPGERKSGPTAIEKICVTLESLLGYQYGEVWDMSFQILSCMFERLGKSAYMMSRAIKNLGEMQKLSDEVLAHRKQLHVCLGAAVGALGPELFLKILPLNLDEDTSQSNAWLLPILKHYIVGASLSFFKRAIIPLIRRLKQKSLTLERDGLIVGARNTEALVYSLWSLLPAFCNYPVDTSSSFEGFQKLLCETLKEEPELRGIICSSLQILVQQNKAAISGNLNSNEDDTNSFEQKARTCYTSDLGEENLKAMRQCSSNFLSVLFEILFKDLKDNGGCLKSTIHEIASISEKRLVKNIFGRKLLTLSKVMKEANNPDHSNSMSYTDENSSLMKRALILDSAVSLLPGLDINDVKIFFEAIKPGFRDAEGLIQKKTYKILSIILKEREEFLSSEINGLLGLMIEELPYCHFSAKRYRLECLYFLILHMSKDSVGGEKQNIISSYLTEIILALKEANKKTRNRAYELLVEIGRSCGDEEQGGKKEHLLQFFNMIAGGLAGETPHMVSAAIKGLARLSYEFSDLISSAYSLLPSAFLLMQRENREITKANLGFLKVLVAKSQSSGLQSHLSGIIGGLLSWRDGTKKHFKSKVKNLIDMLVKKCGLDAVRAVMPEDHMKLLTNIRKISERKERKGKSETGSVYSKATSSRHSKWNHTRIFSTFGDSENGSASAVSGRKSKGNSKASSASRLTRRTAGRKMLSEELLDQLDLLDRQRTRSSLFLDGRKRKAVQEDEPAEIAADGRLVVRDEDLRLAVEEKRHVARIDEAVAEMGGSRSVSGESRRPKRQKMRDAGWAYAGAEYSSKKGKGDMKLKDKLEPYAYWPLDRKLLNRRAELKAAARKGMAKVMTRTSGGGSAATARGLTLPRAQRLAMVKAKAQQRHRHKKH